jgi:photosystem II stability/assembly factor-like uncharacterized protein
VNTTSPSGFGGALSKRKFTMHKPLSILALVVVLSTRQSAFAQHSVESNSAGAWQMQNSTTTANLRGIHAVGGGVAWASGANGTVLRTEDSGYMWQSCAMPPGAEKLDFRGIWAWDANTAIVMSSGPGDQSRLYKTTDGCSHWTLLYTNPDKDGFWDAITFWDRDHGVILGDPVRDTRHFWSSTESEGSPVEKHFVTLETTDGGQHWNWKWPGRGEAPGDGLKDAGAFAASNSALVVEGRWAFIGVGGKSGAHVISGIQDLGDVESENHTFEWMGYAWMKTVSVPVASGTDTSGVFSLAFRDGKHELSRQGLYNWPQHGIAVGGDYRKPNDPTGTAAWTADGGKSWTAAIKPPHGYRSAVAFDTEQKAWIAVGTNGTDVSYDDGKTWSPLDSGNWNALGLPWVVGPGGRIAKLVSLEAATRLH